MTVSRRALIGGAAGAAGLLALAGCASGERRPGPLRVGIAGGGSRERLDPHVLPQYIDQVRARACFDTLVGFSERMTPEPRLARSWEVDPTGTRWRIRLRATRFHDGRPLTATDVLATFARIADPATKASAARLYADVDLTASRAVSDTELEVVLGRPNFLFPLSWGATGTEIVPAGATDFARPVGCGPFRFVSFTPGGPARYRAHEGYWDGAPPSPELEIVPIDQEAARVGALLSGQIDCAYELQPVSARRLESDDRVRLLGAPGGTNQFLCLKVDRPPFADPRLREAVKVGLDREALVRVVLLGRGQVGNDLRGRGLQYYDDAIPQVVHDPDRARALVEAAGARGLPVEIQASTTDPLFTPAATVIGEQLRAIGLDARPRQLSPDGYYGEVQRTGVAALTSGGPLAIPDYVGRKLVTDGTPNFTGYRNPELDRLYLDAIATPDETVRGVALDRVQELFHRESGNLVWGSGDWLLATGAGVGGVDPGPPNTGRWGRFDKATVT